MKILIVDDDKSYLMTYGYLFKDRINGAMDVTYVSSPDDLENLDVSDFDVCMSEFYFGNYGDVADVYQCLRDKGFRGRFIVNTMVDRSQINKKLNDCCGGKFEVIEKGRAARLRTLLQDLSFV